MSIFIAVYCAFVVVWSSSFFSRGTRQPVSQFLAPIAVAVLMTTLPYALTWLAQHFAASPWASRIAFIVTLLCGSTSLLLYAPGLQPYQDGEFGIGFAAGIPQFIVALCALGYVLIDRKRAI
jgi:hypothetical protein